MPKNRWLQATRPLIIGHRGASGDAPENTLAAFRLAHEQGADGIEYDVHLAADGVPVVIHDATLERTTNGMGRVAQYTSAELAQHDAGDGEGIPTLDAVLAEFGDQFLHNIEIKGGTAHSKTLVSAVAATIARHNCAASVAVSSFEESILRAATRLEPPIIQAALIDPKAPQIPSFFAGVAIHPYFATVDEAFMAWAAEHAYRVHVWTIDDVQAAQRLATLGVSAFITNYPARIREGLFPKTSG